MVRWLKDAETPCKCEGKCAHKKPKSAMKHVVPTQAPLYKNANGTSYALSYLASEIGKHFGHLFGAFTIAEEGGHLVIHTELTRDHKFEKLVEEHRSNKACAQPCDGECETSCPAITRLSKREVAGL